MKILITGSTGMVGRNIISHENSQKYKILSPTSSELNLLDKQNKKMNFFFGQLKF